VAATFQRGSSRPVTPADELAPTAVAEAELAFTLLSSGLAPYRAQP